MIYSSGIKWIKSLYDIEIGNKYKARCMNYKKSIKCFNNIDDFLLSIDSNDLEKIMSFERKYVVIEKPNEKLALLMNEISREQDINKYMEKVNTFF